MRIRFYSLEPAIRDGMVCVDASIAQEWPVSARVFALRGIALDDENFLFVVRSFSDYLPKRIGDERIAPELETGIAVSRPAFVADAIHDGDVHAVRDRVCALDCFPCVELRRAELRLLMRMPPDARRIENHLRAAERGKSRTLGIPLIPANLHADFSVLCVEIRKSEIAGSEIKFFVIERVVGNVHLAIFAEIAAIGIDDRARVVIHAGSAPLKKGSHDDDFFLFRNFSESRGRGTRNRLGKIEKLGVFFAAEIFAAKKLVHAHDLRAARGSFANLFDRALEIFFRIRRRAHLNQADGKFIVHKIILTRHGILIYCNCANLLSFLARLYYQSDEI